ncbi:hypothetical protein N7494_000142 [Penicillium frequentans]|uniref:Uncharacterized protein n=1 Tax=Penicillium frequentans TaxID=3151616 RepID=A0AAD6D7N1_9EURO|nr:hypothetical protein N7494_000142 [Penicillium glabrum]
MEFNCYWLEQSVETVSGLFKKLEIKFLVQERQALARRPAGTIWVISPEFGQVGFHCFERTTG